MECYITSGYIITKHVYYLNSVSVVSSPFSIFSLRSDILLYENIRKNDLWIHVSLYTRPSVTVSHGFLSFSRLMFMKRNDLSDYWILSHLSEVGNNSFGPLLMGDWQTALNVSLHKYWYEDGNSPALIILITLKYIVFFVLIDWHAEWSHFSRHRIHKNTIREVRCLSIPTLGWDMCYKYCIIVVNCKDLLPINVK